MQHLQNIDYYAFKPDYASNRYKKSFRFVYIRTMQFTYNRQITEINRIR